MAAQAVGVVVGRSIFWRKLRPWYSANACNVIEDRRFPLSCPGPVGRAFFLYFSDPDSDAQTALAASPFANRTTTRLASAPVLTL